MTYMAKDWKVLADIATAAGWTVEPTNGSHWRWTPPEGEHLITGSTPSDFRAIEKHKSALRRAGLDLGDRNVTIGFVLPAPVLTDICAPEPEPEQQPVPEGGDHALREQIIMARAVLAEIRDEIRAAEATRDQLRRVVRDAVDNVMEDPESYFRTGLEAAVSQGTAWMEDAFETHVNEAADEVGKLVRKFNRLLDEGYNELRGAIDQARGAVPPSPVTYNAAIASGYVPAAFRRASA